MNCNLTMQETQFLTALLGNASISKQTCLQLLAAEHLYIPTLFPKLQAHAKALKQAEEEEEYEKATLDDYCREYPGDQCCKEYDV